MQPARSERPVCGISCPESKECPAKRVEIVIAESIEDQVARLEILTKRYTKEKYFEQASTVKVNMMSSTTFFSQSNDEIESWIKEKLPKLPITKKESAIGNKNANQILREEGLLLEFTDGKVLYFDIYHLHSVPIVAKCGDKVVGSVRIIQNHQNIGLPVFKDHGEYALFEGTKEQVKRCAVEISHYAVDKDSAPLGTGEMLFEAALKVCAEMGVTYTAGVTDDATILKLEKFGYKVQKVGNQVQYMHAGPPIYPVLVEFPERLLVTSQKLEQETVPII